MTCLLNSIDGFRNLPIPEVEEKRQDHFVEPDGQPDELADKLLVGLQRFLFSSLQRLHLLIVGQREECAGHPAAQD